MLISVQNDPPGALTYEGVPEVFVPQMYLFMYDSESINDIDKYSNK